VTQSSDKIEHVDVVLVRPESGEQVGYTARLMSIFGVERGTLVAPNCDINSFESRTAASAQGAMCLATMHTCRKFKDAVKSAKYVISVDADLPGKDEIGLPEVCELTRKSDVVMAWFCDQQVVPKAESMLITHNLRLSRSKFGTSIPTSHSVGICLSRVFEHLSITK
jgi:hypothetical protein